MLYFKQQSSKYSTPECSNTKTRPGEILVKGCITPRFLRVDLGAKLTPSRVIYKTIVSVLGPSIIKFLQKRINSSAITRMYFMVTRIRAVQMFSSLRKRERSFNGPFLTTFSTRTPGHSSPKEKVLTGITQSFVPPTELF